ncbi:hypothetical protein KC335_g101 [Hortaea werneckii]|nr:hypothetical protein KC335_g101 [Hortaea werneckii]
MTWRVLTVVVARKLKSDKSVALDRRCSVILVRAKRRSSSRGEAGCRSKELTLPLPCLQSFNPLMTAEALIRVPPVRRSTPASHVSRHMRRGSQRQRLFVFP